MRCPICVVDAFTTEPFRGNAAGVCLLEGPADEAWMQHVAAEMKHSETAFTYPSAEGRFSLRWFTPGGEVDLCGHATLATAHVLFSIGRMSPTEPIRFQTKSGELLCHVRSDGMIEMDFPAEPPRAIPMPSAGRELFPRPLIFFGENRMDHFAVLEDEASVRAFVANSPAVLALGGRGLIITAKSSDPVYDFVSRFFAPAFGIPEDPVTGSAHCALGPYWSSVLGKQSLVGHQLSERGGVVRVDHLGERVILSGNAVTVLQGEWTA